jgi:trehalose 6-phosphate phosphatase
LARTPDRVKVPFALHGALEALSQKLSGALALVSGRSLDSIDKLFAPFRPAAIGTHGGEIRGIGGAVTRGQSLPDWVREIFKGLADNIPGLLLEDKKSAIALHYRLAPEAQAVLVSAMDKHAKRFEAENIRILYGKAVIEACPVGVDKGTAVAALAKQKPFAGRTILFGGDDTTDLDVFRILPDLGGYGFSVGRRFDGADYIFESPHAVRQWLVQEAGGGLP